VPKTFLVDWRLCVTCYYNTTPTDYPSTTRGTSVGPPVAVNINFMDIFDFWALDLSELYWYSTPLTTFLINIGQCWYFSPQWTPVHAINKLSSVWTVLVNQEKVRSYYVSTYKLGVNEGFRRWSGYILAPQRNPDLEGSCSLASHCSLSDRSEQNASELRHTVCNTFISSLAF